MNNFKIWADEINKDWIGGYSATATEDSLSVQLNGKEVANVNSNFDVTGSDSDAVEQLNYMVTR